MVKLDVAGALRCVDADALRDHKGYGFSLGFAHCFGGRRAPLLMAQEMVSSFMNQCIEFFRFTLTGQQTDGIAKSRSRCGRNVLVVFKRDALRADARRRT